MTQVTKTRWFLPLFAVALGLLFFTVQWIGDDPKGGLVSLGIMVAFGALILVGGRSETIRGLRGDGRDERFAMIDLKATAFAGMVLIGTVIGAFAVEMARGEDGSPYSLLGAVGGIAYLVAVVGMRIRG